MSVYDLGDGSVGELHIVGQPYLGERGPRPPGFEYNWYGDRHMLRLWMENPSPAEIDSVHAGDGEFALTVKPPIIFFLFRFAPGIPWNTTMDTWHLLAPETTLLWYPGVPAPVASTRGCDKSLPHASYK